MNVLANPKGSVGRWNQKFWRLEQFYTNFWSKGVVDTYSWPIGVSKRNKGTTVQQPKWWREKFMYVLKFGSSILVNEHHVDTKKTRVNNSMTNQALEIRRSSGPKLPTCAPNCDLAMCQCGPPYTPSLACQAPWNIRPTQVPPLALPLFRPKFKRPPLPSSSSLLLLPPPPFTCSSPFPPPPLVSKRSSLLRCPALRSSLRSLALRSSLLKKWVSFYL